VTTPRNWKTIKLVAGILLVPCCVAVTVTFLHQLGIMGRGGGLLRDWRFLCLALGFILWLLVYLVMPPPMRVYVFGHELTHAAVGLLMGARVRRFQAGAKSGQVTLSRTNFLITLSPYFVPIYCVLAMLVFLAGDLMFDWQRYLPALCILVGAGWGFHLTYTVQTLMREQSDVTRNGWLFSMTLIYWMNLLVLGLLLAAITSRGRVWTFARLLWQEHLDVWTWLLRAFGAPLG
jgi:hypothetical protein